MVAVAPLVVILLVALATVFKDRVAAKAGCFRIALKPWPQ